MKNLLQTLIMLVLASAAVAAPEGITEIIPERFANRVNSDEMKQEVDRLILEIQKMSEDQLREMTKKSFQSNDYVRYINLLFSTTAAGDIRTQELLFDIFIGESKNIQTVTCEYLVGLQNSFAFVNDGYLKKIDKGTIYTQKGLIHKFYRDRPGKLTPEETALVANLYVQLFEVERMQLSLEHPPEELDKNNRETDK